MYSRIVAAFGIRVIRTRIKSSKQIC